MQELLWYICSPVWVSSTQWLYSGAHGNLLYKDLCHTLSPPGLLLPDPLSLKQASAAQCLWRRPSNSYRHVWGNLLLGGGVVTTPFPGSWCTQGFVCAFQASPESMRFDLNMTALLLPSCHSFSFALGFGVPFFGVFQHSPIDVCSAASCDFGVLAGWDDCTSFYSAILDCSLPVSSAHGILQARILECVVILFSRGSFNLGTKPGSPASQACCFTIWATREVLPMRWLNINILFGST